MSTFYSNSNSRPHRSKPNIRINHLRAPIITLHIGRDAAALITITARRARLALLVRRVGRVEPEHVGVVVVPDGHDQDHGHAQRRVELAEAADLGEAVAVAEGLELRRAVVRRDVGAVRRDAVPGRCRDVDLLAVLDEELGEFVFFEAGDDAVCLLVTLGTSGRGKGRTYVNFLLVSTVLPLP